MFFVTFWSVVMSVLWKLDSVYAWSFVVYSILSGVSVILFRSAKAEQINYKLFQVRPFTLPPWLSIKPDLLGDAGLEVSYFHNTRILPLRDPLGVRGREKLD